MTTDSEIEAAVDACVWEPDYEYLGPRSAGSEPVADA
jgi:hypothetical protein